MVERLTCGPRSGQFTRKTEIEVNPLSDICISSVQTLTPSVNKNALSQNRKIDILKSKANF